MMYEIIEEGKCKIKVPTGKITKKLPVFYNPVMEYNRTISVMLLNAVEDKDMQLGLPLAGSGVRGLRFVLELGKGKIRNITFNDSSKKAVENIKNNLKMNTLKNQRFFVSQKSKISKDIKKTKKIILKNQDANDFLLQSTGFDYIDIDPFGTPNPFLDSAVKRLARCGILAVTATDTGCLAGTYPKTCMRKYWGKPLRNEMMHETGLRILIRKVQMVAGQFDKALTPIFSYSKDHYLRVFFRCKKGKKRVDEIIKQHKMVGEAGPMWIGELWDSKLVSKMAKGSKDKFLNIIRKESKIKTVGFYDIHALAKRHKLKIPKTEVLVKKIRKQKYKVSPTHFSETGLRSDIDREKLLKLF